jgi:hypothetical protein
MILSITSIVLNFIHTLLHRIHFLIEEVKFLPAIIKFPFLLCFFIAELLIELIWITFNFLVSIIFRTTIPTSYHLLASSSKLLKYIYKFFKKSLASDSKFHLVKFNNITNIKKYEIELLREFQIKINQIKRKKQFFSFNSNEETISRLKKNINQFHDSNNIYKYDKLLLELQTKESNLISNYVASVEFARLEYRRENNSIINDKINLPTSYFLNFPMETKI